MKFKTVTLGNGATEIINVDSPPSLIRRGVLSLKVTEKGKLVTTPVYIVEYAKEQGGVDLVSVFAIKKGSTVPEKDFEVVTEELKYKDSTFLGKFANNMLKNQKNIPEKRTVRVKPPLFIAPVVIGVGTFTGKIERGFYERERDRFKMIGNKEMAVEYGSNTGVFIGLNSVKWEKTYVNAGDLVQDFVADKQLWFDFGAQNKPQFKSESHGQI